MTNLLELPEGCSCVIVGDNRVEDPDCRVHASVTTQVDPTGQSSQSQGAEQSDSGYADNRCEHTWSWINERDWRMMMKALAEYRTRLAEESTPMEVARLNMYIEEMRDVSRR